MVTFKVFKHNSIYALEKVVNDYLQENQISAEQIIKFDVSHDKTLFEHCAILLHTDVLNKGDEHNE